MSTRSLNWLKLTAVVAPAFVLGLFFAGLLDFPRPSFAQDRNAHTPIVKVDAPRIPAARALVDLSDAYAAVAEAVRPSVVYIQSDRPVTQDPQSQLFGQLPPGFQQLVPRQQQRRGGTNNNNDQPQLEHGSGSGFIVSNDGYILTNNHVIEGSSKVTVRLLNGREYDAKIIGSDKDTDIGVLKINATGLTPAALGSSDATRVGEWVLAIGNPLGADLTFTVTQGIVSAKGRANLDIGDRTDGKLIQDYLQTDAVINRGNSGGPLVNARGEVIGINAAIASQTGYFTGYAFAVPIDLARHVMDQLVARGHVERAGLGISVETASREDAEYLGLPSVTGVRIESFPETSPAKAAGLQAGDVIVAIDGQQIEYTSQLQQTVGFRRPGDVLKVDILRKDGKHEYSVKLVALDQPTTVGEVVAPEASPKAEPAAAGSVSKTMLGLVTEPLTAVNAADAGFATTQRGLLIRSVIDGSPASTKAFCAADDCQGPPDVIISVEGKPVKNDEELKAALAGAVHGVVTLEIASGGKDHKISATRMERVRLR